MSEEKLISEGEFVFPNGDEYRGSFISSDNGIQMHGAGVLTSKQGYTYEGSWEHDKMCGLGKLSMADNSVYEGEFVDSKFHGKGSLTWPDGSRYDGHFQDSKPDGEGKYYDVENRQSWIGRFYPKGALQLQHILQAPVMIE